MAEALEPEVYEQLRLQREQEKQQKEQQLQNEPEDCEQLRQQREQEKQQQEQQLQNEPEDCEQLRQQREQKQQLREQQLQNEPEVCEQLRQQREQEKQQIEQQLRNEPEVYEQFRHQQQQQQQEQQLQSEPGVYEQLMQQRNRQQQEQEQLQNEQGEQVGGANRNRSQNEARMQKLSQLLQDIKFLKKHKREGHRLALNQIAKIENESKYRKEFHELRQKSIELQKQQQKNQQKHQEDVLKDKIMKTKKKLTEIKELKEQRSRGRQIDQNQEAKINREVFYETELSDLMSLMHKYFAPATDTGAVNKTLKQKIVEIQNHLTDIKKIKKIKESGEPLSPSEETKLYKEVDYAIELVGLEDAMRECTEQSIATEKEWRKTKKKIYALRKKLTEIDELKDLVVKGRVLDSNQEAKFSKEFVYALELVHLESKVRNRTSYVLEEQKILNIKQEESSDEVKVSCDTKLADWQETSCEMNDLSYTKRRRFSSDNNDTALNKFEHVTDLEEMGSSEEPDDLRHPVEQEDTWTPAEKREIAKLRTLLEQELLGRPMAQKNLRSQEEQKKLQIIEKEEKLVEQEELEEQMLQKELETPVEQKEPQTPTENKKLRPPVEGQEQEKQGIKKNNKEHKEQQTPMEKKKIGAQVEHEQVESAAKQEELGSPVEQEELRPLMEPEQLEPSVEEVKPRKELQYTDSHAEKWCFGQILRISHVLTRIQCLIGYRKRGVVLTPEESDLVANEEESRKMFIVLSRIYDDLSGTDIMEKNEEVNEFKELLRRELQGELKKHIDEDNQQAQLDLKMEEAKEILARKQLPTEREIHQLQLENEMKRNQLKLLEIEIDEINRQHEEVEKEKKKQVKEMLAQLQKESIVRKTRTEQQIMKLEKEKEQLKQQMKEGEERINQMEKKEQESHLKDKDKVNQIEEEFRQLVLKKEQRRQVGYERMERLILEELEKHKRLAKEKKLNEVKQEEEINRLEEEIRQLKDQLNAMKMQEEADIRQQMKEREEKCKRLEEEERINQEKIEEEIKQIAEEEKRLQKYKEDLISQRERDRIIKEFLKGDGETRLLGKIGEDHIGNTNIQKAPTNQSRVKVLRSKLEERIKQKGEERKHQKKEEDEDDETRNRS